MPMRKQTENLRGLKGGIQVRLIEVLHLDESSRQITEQGLLATLTSK